MKQVYAHIDNNDKVFWVGSGGPIRPYEVKEVRRNAKWKAHFDEHGLKEVVILTSLIDDADALAYETALSKALRIAGEPLTNIKDGQTFTMDSETKVKLSKALKGKPAPLRTALHRKNNGIANRGKKRTAEQKARIAEGTRKALAATKS